MRKYRTKKQYVYEYLKKMIITGGLEPGARIIYRDIAKQLNVSENPVREAIHQLQTDGLTEIKPHVGSIVTILPREDLENIYDLRIILEPKAAKLAAENMNEPDYENLESIIKEAEQIVDEDLLYSAELNKKFHTEIYKHANNPYLFKTIEELWTIQFPYTIMFYSMDHVRHNLEDHRLILHALREKESELVESLIVVHQRKSKEKMIKLLESKDRERE